MGFRQMSPMEYLEWAAKTPEMTNVYVGRLFLMLKVENEEDKRRAVEILEKHRPTVLETIASISKSFLEYQLGDCKNCRNCTCGKKKPNEDKPSDNAQDKPFGDAQDKPAQ